MSKYTVNSFWNSLNELTYSELHEVARRLLDALNDGEPIDDLNKLMGTMAFVAESACEEIEEAKRSAAA